MNLHPIYVNLAYSLLLHSTVPHVQVKIIIVRFSLSVLAVGFGLFGSLGSGSGSSEKKRIRILSPRADSCKYIFLVT